MVICTFLNNDVLLSSELGHGQPWVCSEPFELLLGSKSHWLQLVTPHGTSFGHLSFSFWSGGWEAATVSSCCDPPQSELSLCTMWTCFVLTFKHLKLKTSLANIVFLHRCVLDCMSELPFCLIKIKSCYKSSVGQKIVNIFSWPVEKFTHMTSFVTWFVSWMIVIQPVMLNIFL